MLKHETDLRALHDTLVAEVTREFLGVRVEHGATQERLRQVGGVAAAAAAPKSAAGVPQAQPPQSSDPFLRADPWGAAANLGGSAGSRPPTDGLFPFELDFRMWEGPSRDRKPLEMSKDTTGYGAWRDRNLTVIAFKYPAVRDLLMAAEQEKGPIDDGVEVALAAKVECLCQSQRSDFSPIRSLSMSSFFSMTTSSRPRRQLELVGGLSCGESSMTWSVAARISSTARRSSFTRTPAVAGAWTTWWSAPGSVGRLRRVFHRAAALDGS